MKILKLKSGKVEIILENNKEIQGMLIKHYASIENIVDGIKMVCETQFNDDDHNELQDLYDHYESLPGEEERVLQYNLINDILEKK